MVPDSVLKDFFRKARTSMMECEVSSFQSLAECRELLWKVQLACLDQIIRDYNDDNVQTSSTDAPLLTTEMVQKALAEDVHVASEDVQAMNDAARVSLARLVLQSQTSSTLVPSTQQKKVLTRKDVLDFCGLVNAALCVDEVQRYASRQQDTLFYDTNKKDRSARERMEEIKHLLWKALAHDPLDISKQLKQVLDEQPTEDEEDDQLVPLFFQTCSNMMQVVAKAEEETNSDSVAQNDGVTRVVSVQYSETMVHMNPQGTEAVPAVVQPPQEPTTIHQEQQDEHLWNVHRQTAALQQTLLNELLNMSVQDRQLLLQQAQQAVQDLQTSILTQKSSSKMEVLQSMDSETRRLLAMHSIWQSYENSCK